MYTVIVELIVREAIQKAFALSGVKDAIVALKRPPNLSFGDYATFVGMSHATEVAKNLKEILGDAVTSIDVVDPGFINIKLSSKTIADVINQAGSEGNSWGRAADEAGKRVMVEYTDPNPFKEMHIGHLMSNIIGESTARLIENRGATVIRANYQGDIGPHVAKALWGLRTAGIDEPGSAKELGEAYAAGSRAYDDDVNAKKQIDALNIALYQRTDPSLTELWRKGRDVSISAFEDLYRILGTKFDYYFFESETAESGERIVRDGLHKGIFEESEGAVIYNGEKKGLHTLVFITSRDTPTYEAKEIGLAFLKEERARSDKSIVITAAEQIGHFRVVLAALEELAPTIAAKTIHVPHGFLRLTSGKMSSRDGNVITARDFIAQMIEIAAEKNADPLVANQVALGAIKYMILRQAPGSDIIFDTEKSLSLDGDSGPYLQYALVRAKKILSYATTGEGGADVPREPYTIERLIVHFPEVTARAARELSPNLLVTYLTELAGEWNSLYAREQILGSPEEAYKQRVARAFVNTMTQGLMILGIPAPERM